MAEIMKRRFFHPIWKCDEIERGLGQLEKDGWRLDKIAGLRKFVFTKASPKDTTYFITCSLAKESGMSITEEALTRKYNANRVNGNFIEGLKITSVYRICQEADDMFQRRVYRNIYLRHLVLQYLLIELFLLLISVAGIILSCFVNGNPFFMAEHIFFLFIGVYGGVATAYYLLGWLYLRKKYSELYLMNREKMHPKN